MKIAIDCRLWGKSGIGVYLENILYYLIHNSSHTFLLIGDEPLLKNYPRSEHLTVSTPPFSIQELFRFPVKEINQCDLFYTPNFNIPGGIKIPIYSTIHDVVFLDMPLVSFLGKKIRYWFLKRAIRKTNLLFTVSNFSKARIEAHFNIKTPIIVTYNGIARKILTYEKTAQSPFPFNYFLFVGNIKIHKGIGTLLHAYRIARNNGEKRKLVIVGEYQNFKTVDKKIYAQINTLLHADQDIIFTGKISDEELYAILAHASVLVQPSLYEGFGIPPLEAMFLGTPAILSDIRIFREIYNQYPVTFFPVGEYKELADAMRQATGERLSLSVKLAENFNYSAVANQMLNYFDKRNENSSIR